MAECKKCGWTYFGKYCPKCGTEFIDEGAIDTSELTLSSDTDEDREARARRNLWDSLHERCDDVTECRDYAGALKRYAPKDYYANFAEAVCGGNKKAVSKFLRKSGKKDIAMYADAVLDYMCGHMSADFYFAVGKYNDRASLKDSGVYATIIERYVPDSVVRKRKREDDVRIRREARERERNLRRERRRAGTPYLSAFLIVMLSVFVVMLGISFVIGIYSPTAAKITLIVVAVAEFVAAAILFVVWIRVRRKINNR